MGCPVIRVLCEMAGTANACITAPAHLFEDEIIGGWPSFRIGVQDHERGCPSFASVAKLGATDLIRMGIFSGVMAAAVENEKSVVPTPVSTTFRKERKLGQPVSWNGRELKTGHYGIPERLNETRVSG